MEGRQNEFNFVECEPETFIKYEVLDEDDLADAALAQNLEPEKIVLKPHNSNLKRHTKPQCEICKKTYANKCSLYTHMKLHEKEAPFKCSFCEKTFKLNFYLQTHLRVHTGEKPFECIMCGRKFSQKNALNYHTKSHFNDRPFKCSCGAAFKLHNYLIKHLSSDHLRSFTPRASGLELVCEGEEISDRDDFEDETEYKSEQVLPSHTISEVSDFMPALDFQTEQESGMQDAHKSLTVPFKESGTSGRPSRITQRVARSSTSSVETVLSDTQSRESNCLTVSTLDEIVPQKKQKVNPQIDRHLRIRLQEKETMSFNCKDCSAVFCDNSTFRRHIRLHSKAQAE